MDHDEALIELRQTAGSQLDENLVAFFCEIPKHRIEECRDYVIGILESYRNE
jgi:HD-GYP domain-containing protein (c-di-GMP phosphodiesterase class II)